MPGSEPQPSGLVLRSTELAIVGLTPAVALLVAPTSVAWAFLLWVSAIAAAGRFTVRPLARLASRAQLQRDLVVAATEAERARVAADIHDDALQELTLLVRRLDAAGDAEGAEIARTVSDKLRAICGDLRLPILDDLGVGPALDWLVLRIERLAGGEVRLERADGTRPPPDVELAFFRIAHVSKIFRRRVCLSSRRRPRSNCRAGKLFRDIPSDPSLRTGCSLCVDGNGRRHISGFSPDPK